MNALKAVFISSTYKDLALHRRAVWEKLKDFDVAIRGMEEFGARTAGPLETCLAEVEQCDVYVGIIAFRMGSIDPESRKSFTQLEYEHALELKREVLIYLADEETARFPIIHIDDDTRIRKRLIAFKAKLRERHTVETFSTPEDLAEKLSRDFKKRFSLREPESTAQQRSSEETEFAKTATALEEFRLTPKKLNGHEVRLAVGFTWGPYAASRALCTEFNLEYGLTIGAHIVIAKPVSRSLTSGFTELYATGNKVDALRDLIKESKADIYARLQFSEKDVRGTMAEFLGRTYYDDGSPEYDGDPREVYVPPEGKVILLFSKRST